MRYRVGVCQYKPKLFAVSDNLKKLEDMLSPHAGKADLMVLPELAPSGYVFSSKEEVLSVAEDPLDGPTATLFKKIAHRYETSFVIGFAEKCREKVYNSAMLVNPDRSVKVYRKTHLFFEEKRWFLPGDTGFKVFKAKKDVAVGLMVCFDWIFPESARTLALRGAQIICHPANLVLPWCQQAMPTRAIENRVFTITSNRTGLEKNKGREFFFTGQSQITDVKGKIYHRMNEDEESVFIQEIETDDALDKNVTEFNNVISDLRYDQYVYFDRQED